MSVGAQWTANSTCLDFINGNHRAVPPAGSTLALVLVYLPITSAKALAEIYPMEPIPAVATEITAGSLAAAGVAGDATVAVAVVAAGVGTVDRTVGAATVGAGVGGGVITGFGVHASNNNTMIVATANHSPHFFMVTSSVTRTTD
ncbi:MAG: hypothetical protein HW399_482 [Dehalococcoidia bacterium]|nr:hypothetical protein [Dehalococcoidia bacterium]